MENSLLITSGRGESSCLLINGRCRKVFVFFENSPYDITFSDQVSALLHYSCDASKHVPFKSILVGHHDKTCRKKMDLHVFVRLQAAIVSVIGLRFSPVVSQGYLHQVLGLVKNNYYVWQHWSGSKKSFRKRETFVQQQSYSLRDSLLKSERTPVIFQGHHHSH